MTMLTTVSKKLFTLKFKGVMEGNERPQPEEYYEMINSAL